MPAKKSSLLKPLKPADKNWTRKERYMVLGLLGITLLGICFFWLKGHDLSPASLKPKFTNWFRLPEDKIIIEAPHPPSTSDKAAQDSKSEFLSLTKDLSGSYGFYVYRLKDNTHYGLHSTDTFTAASLIKLPVLIALYQAAETGDTNLDDTYSLKEEDKVAGAGSLQYAKVGSPVTYRKLTQMMGKSSDNTAQHIVVNRLGQSRVEETIQKIGMTQTNYEDNTTTPADVGLLFQKLYQDKLISPEHKQEILDYLTQTDFEDRIPAGVPKSIKVAHKIGTETGVFADAGIIFTDPPFILVIMSQNARQDEAQEVLPQITSAIYHSETE